MARRAVDGGDRRQDLPTAAAALTGRELDGDVLHVVGLEPPVAVDGTFRFAFDAPGPVDSVQLLHGVAGYRQPPAFRRGAVGNRFELAFPAPAVNPESRRFWDACEQGRLQEWSAMLGLLVVAEEFVLTIFGPKWVGMIPALRVLCLVGLMQSVNATVGWIYNSQGRSDIQFWWILFGGILSIIAFAIGLTWGILGVSVAYAIRVFSTTWLNFTIPGRLIGMTFRDVARALYQPLLLSVGMALLVLLTGWLIPEDWPPVLRLAFLVTTGCVAYVGAIHVLRLPAYTDMMRIVRERASGIKQQVSHST